MRDRTRGTSRTPVLPDTSITGSSSSLQDRMADTQGHEDSRSRRTASKASLRRSPAGTPLARSHRSRISPLTTVTAVRAMRVRRRYQKAGGSGANHRCSMSHCASCAADTTTSRETQHHRVVTASPECHMPTPGMPRLTLDNKIMDNQKSIPSE